MRQFRLAGLLRRKAARHRRGSVSVEFALVSLFFLVPLFGGGADFVLIMTAQAQLRTAVQALDYFAWTNPDEANNPTDAGFVINLINPHSDYQITLPANPTLSFNCLSSPVTSTQQELSTFSSTTCPTGQGLTQRTFVTYQVTTKVFLPIPLPGLSSLSATSTVQIQ